MATDLTFDVTIQPVGDFFVGQEKKNQFQVTITYRGDPGRLHFNECIFWLRVGVGHRAEDLVLGESAANKIGTETSHAAFTADGSISKEAFVWKILAYDTEAFTSEKPLTLTFSNVESDTKPGTAKLMFEVVIGEKTEQYPPLELTKQTNDQPAIVYFYSTTAARVKSQSVNSIFPADEQILPGERVTFHWQVQKLNKLTLKRGGILNIPLTETDLKQGKKEVANITEDSDFILSGLGPQNEEVAAKVNVKILQTGWHGSQTLLGETELEPTCIFSGDVNNPTIYAVFRRNRGKHEEGFLFQTENPFWGWSQMLGKVPDGFTTSPGVYHQNKLWLIGGSQIDPEITSNEIWVTEIPKAPDLPSGEWKKLTGVIPWSPRMGHAVLVYENAIWVLGGCDENGNALKDGWQFDVSTSKWSSLPNPPWSPRCMLSAVPFTNGDKREVWLCGGAKELLSDEFSRDLWIYRSTGKWEGPTLLLKNTPLGAMGLQVFRQEKNERLHLIGQITEPPVETCFYWLPAPSKPDAWANLPKDQLQGWAGEDLTVVYQMVNLRNELLIAKALGYKQANRWLKVYVPENARR